MESLTVSLLSLTPIQNNPKTHKTTFETPYVLPILLKNRFCGPKFASQAFNSHRADHLHRKSFKTSETTLCVSHSPSNQTTTVQTLLNFLQNRFLIQKTASFVKIRTTHSPISLKNHNPVHKTASLVKISSAHLSNPPQNHLLILQTASCIRDYLKLQLSLALVAVVSAPFSCLASEITISSEQIPEKINLESILISIDDFFNRNPFFVSGVTFIWLVVIPLTEQYLRKFKFISAIDAFRKLRDDPNSQLLDIRDKKSLIYLRSPNLKILNKSAVQVQFSEGEEEEFAKKVLENFTNPGNTTLCVLDNFDGNSMKVAELLFKNGFKMVYAIKGGLRGKDGWQAIQESLLPPSVHVFPRKGEKSKQVEMNGEGTSKPTEDNGQTPSSTTVSVTKGKGVGNGYINSIGPTPQENLGSSRPSSPYPNYPDMKPPSSPTPKKP